MNGNFESTPPQPAPNGLNEFEQEMLDEFCEEQRPDTPQEQVAVDQAASEFRDQLKSMGLTIESDEQFHTACIVSIATAVNMRKLTEMGLPLRIAENVSNKTIAALRPDTST
jgi:hypothetical protein